MILGGDGYLGWSLGLAFGNRTDEHVVLVDNFVKRQWEEEVNAKLLVPFKEMPERLALYNKLFNRSNISFEKVELMDYDAVAKVIKKHKPYAIINAAQQPSAPFSMMNAKNASVTFQNNILGHLNILWAISDIDKDITYIKLGSGGCYMDIDTDYVPLEKVDLDFTKNGKAGKILNSWIPMQATDFYHQSKISDFLINDLCATMWGLKVVTVQQATIFGATIAENLSLSHHGLSTRFNYDAVFSTVLNRFVCQLAIGHPLTVYGDGNQTTGLISLSDTVDNFLKFSKMKVKHGEHKVVHNYTLRYSILDIAKKLIAIDKNAKASFIKNPRKEGVQQLSKSVEVHELLRDKHENKEANLDKELADLLAFTALYKHNIDPSIIIPKVDWEKSAKMKVSEVNERSSATEQNMDATLAVKTINWEEAELKVVK